MASLRARDESHAEPPVTVPPRTWRAAAQDALPSFLAALLCALTWFDPRFLGLDTLRIAAPMFFLELPLAIVIVFADAWRVPGEFLDRRTKLRLIVLPAIVVGIPCWLLFGGCGLFAVAWLGAGALWRLVRDGEDRRVTGRWLVLRHRDGGETERWVVRTRPDLRTLPGAWIVPLTHHEFLPGITVAAWLGLAFVLFTGLDIPAGGALPAYAASVGWNDTPVGALVPAHEALAAGVALFLIRCVSHFDDIGDDVAPVSIADDADLREIVDRIDRKHR